MADLNVLRILLSGTQKWNQWRREHPEIKIAYLDGTEIRGLNLAGADLRGALFYNTDLSNSDLQGADLREAHLAGANLKGVNMKGAVYDNSTMWPVGFDPQ